MSAVIVTGDTRTVVASLTIDKSAATAGEALAAAVTIKACLLNQATRVAVTPIYELTSDDVDTEAGTVSVTLPAEDTADLDPSVVTVMEIELTDGDDQKTTFTDLGPILIKRGAIT
jgi:hypothetical protein